MSEHVYRSRPVGRSTDFQPPNRFAKESADADWSELSEDDVAELAPRSVATEFLPDASQSIVSYNSSPDIPFNVSLNPYRGCEHGCSYCYARPTHEYLGFSAGLEFETKVLVKHDAADLLRKELCKKSWKVQPISFSGVTDCYQPAERRFRLTRACLEVLLEARHPVTIITKNALILRDLDLFDSLARQNLVRVAVSLTTLDPELARRMEPRTSAPAARLRAIARLSQAGIPVAVMTAPLIPGLNDHEAPALLAAARENGAISAGYALLRLPMSVEPVFLDWLGQNYPERVERIVAVLRESRSGRLSDSRFGARMRGDGRYADQLARTYRVFTKKLGFREELPELDCTRFQPPDSQRRLF